VGPAKPSHDEGPPPGLALEISATEAHILAAAAIWAAATAARDDDPEPTGASEARPLIEAALERKGSLLVLLAPDGEMLAFATAEPLDGARAAAHIGYLAVSPERWGEGLGGALLRGLPGCLGELGFERAQLAVYEDNPRALALYEGGGWKRTGRSAVHPRSGRLLLYYELVL
jgi:ribosomal protein S18 acetylase RimI-like enzyme